MNELRHLRFDFYIAVSVEALVFIYQVFFEKLMKNSDQHDIVSLAIWFCVLVSTDFVEFLHQVLCFQCYALSHVSFCCSETVQAASPLAASLYFDRVLCSYSPPSKISAAF